MSGAGASETPSISTSRKRAAADREIRRRAERLEHRVGQRRIVVRIKPERVADLVVEPALGQIELDVPGLLRGARLVEQRRAR